MHFKFVCFFFVWLLAFFCEILSLQVCFAAGKTGWVHFQAVALAEVGFDFC